MHRGCVAALGQALDRLPRIFGEASASRRALLGGSALAGLGLTTERTTAKHHRRPAGGCLAMWDGNQELDLANFQRAGQAFVATRSGQLRQIAVTVVPLDELATIVLQLVRSTGGVPSNAAADVLAVAAAQPSAVVGDPGVLTVRIAEPRLTSGQEYAVVVAQPGPIGFNVPVQSGAGCNHPALVADGDGPFAPTPVDGQMLIRVWVG
jgi:hypothetical protein